MMAPVGFGMRFSRLKTLRASSNGQALLTWAWARSSEFTSILGVRGALFVCGVVMPLGFRGGATNFTVFGKAPVFPGGVGQEARSEQDSPPLPLHPQLPTVAPLHA